MTLGEFEGQVYAVALSSPICGVPIVRRLTPTSINLRLDMEGEMALTIEAMERRP